MEIDVDRLHGGGGRGNVGGGLDLMRLEVRLGLD
jgi:hypothetical protein